MIIVCTSKSGILFNDSFENRAEYGDMYTAVYTEQALQNVWRVDIGGGMTNFISAVSGHWRLAKNLEKDLFYNGKRNLDKLTKF